MNLIQCGVIQVDLSRKLSHDPKRRLGLGIALFLFETKATMSIGRKLTWPIGNIVFQYDNTAFVNFQSIIYLLLLLLLAFGYSVSVLVHIFHFILSDDARLEEF